MNPSRGISRSGPGSENRNLHDEADYTERFIKSLEAAPPQIRKAFYKQSRLLLEDPRHPSLRAKKYDESRNIWQARVTRDWRFYFRIVADTYYLVDIIAHPK